MASPDAVYREYTIRSHRTLAAFLSVHAWTNDLDCVGLEREVIVGYWGIAKRVEGQRLEWFRADVSPYFPHVQVLWRSTGTQKFGSLFLSRRPFPAGAFSGSMRSVERATRLTASGLRAAVVTLPSEMEMLAKLTNAIHGLAVFADRKVSIPKPPSSHAVLPHSPAPLLN